MTRKFPTYVELEDRFWIRVDKNGPIHPVHGQCWVWLGRKKNGYGSISLDCKRLYAHRVSWEIHNELVPNEICVLHKCDNILCVNPSHLFLGTHIDNMNDRSYKGRQPVGSKLKKSTLTEEKVIEIRKTYTAGCRKNGAMPLARKYRVVVSTIMNIIRRETWTHI